MLRKLGIFFLSIGIVKIAYALIKGATLKASIEVNPEDTE